MTSDPFSNHPQPNELLLEYQDFPKEYNEQFRVQLIQMINDICIAINSKESGFYSDETTLTSEKVLPTYCNDLTGAVSVYHRTVRRKVIFSETLPNSSAKVIPHNIVYPNGSVGWRLWGGASILDGDKNLNGFLQLPYAHPTPANCISLFSDRNNIIITTGVNRTNFNFSFVVIEYAVPPYTYQ